MLSTAQKFLNKSYAAAGVNIELGDAASRILYEAAKASWQGRQGKIGEVIVPFDDFSGIRAIDVSNLPPGSLMNINFDSIGTKTEIAERMSDHSSMAFDLFAMVCDDAVVRGGEPVLVGSILEVSSLGTDGANYIEHVKQLAQGYTAAAKAANVAIVNGEVAEVGQRVKGYGPFNYNWGAAVVWFARKDRMLTGREIRADDAIIAFKDPGFRSNGLSLARRILTNLHGKEWHHEKLNGEFLGKQCLTPSVIYCSAVVQMFGGFQQEPQVNLSGIVHVTGGGIPGKLGRVLKPTGLGADLFDLFEPHPLMRYCQEKGTISDEEAYRTWHMGQGMLILSPQPDQVLALAQRSSITAKVVGRVREKPGITIKNKGFFADQNKELAFKS